MSTEPGLGVGQDRYRVRRDRVGEHCTPPQAEVLQHFEFHDIVEPVASWHSSRTKAAASQRMHQRGRLKERHMWISGITYGQRVNREANGAAFPVVSGRTPPGRSILRIRRSSAKGSIACSSTSIAVTTSYENGSSELQAGLDRDPEVTRPTSDRPLFEAHR